VTTRTFQIAKAAVPRNATSPCGVGYAQEIQGSANRAVLVNRAVSETILIVEDEPAIAESLAYALEREGFTTHTAHDFSSAWNLRSGAQLMVLDLMLPDGNGVDLLGQLRAEGSRTPVIVLSSREAEADRVGALEAGADDYVTKPFSPREVVARIRAVLRRAVGGNPANHPIVTHLANRKATVSGRPLDLTRVEFDLLSVLSTTLGKVYTRADLIDRVWGAGFRITDRTIDSHIKSLRRKVADAGGDANWIETVRGVGYCLREVDCPGNSTP
jgi:two-component system catabolic regulation response regulator CreB